MKILTAESMRAAEELSVKQGLGWIRLMENAGSAAARVIRSHFEVTNKKIVVVVSHGNNGGDGYVVARKLKENGCTVNIIRIGGTPKTPTAMEMLAMAKDVGAEIVDFESSNQFSYDLIMNSDIIVDAIFGTGFSGELTEPFGTIIEQINMSPAAVVSLDLPSGCIANSSLVGKHCINADITIAFCALKPCHVLLPAADSCGKIYPVSIGMPESSLDLQTAVMTSIEKDYIAVNLPKRHKNSNKGSFGTASLICGSYGMAGAAVIAAKAAIRSGVGIAKLIIPDKIYNIVAANVLEAVCCPLSSTADGTLSYANASRVINEINLSSAAAIGCGLGKGYDVNAMVESIIKCAKVPLVIDADGINAIASRIDIIKQCNSPVILTPHPGEAARILNCTAEDIQNDRLGSAKKIAALSGAITVLKGANTLIATPSGEVSVCLFGNAGMATAGAGDMLTGVIAALLAQGLDSQKAAVCGVGIHALSGDFALKTVSDISMSPLDMIDSLSSLFLNLQGR
ncbi:MAG: NAD(P)H-hydrate dehydratase [Oscillospiraceae bacterium]